jgi:hypothetical protein
MDRKSPKKGPINKGFDYILNCVPSLNPEKDWTIAAALESNTIKLLPHPPSKDLREDSWWPIGNQRETGSCVGWGTADSVLRWYFVKAKRLAKSQPLSVRYVWMAAKETDDYTQRPSTFIERAGTSLKAALDIARNFGVVTDSIVPFSPPALYVGDPKTFWEAFWALAAQLKISSYFALGRELDYWRGWISNYGPILTRLEVDNEWYAADQKKGVLKSYTYPGPDHGHCVALVGYTPEYFIVRNSWGTSHGDDGYYYAYDSYAQIAFNEAYAIVL